MNHPVGFDWISAALDRGTLADLAGCEQWAEQFCKDVSVMPLSDLNRLRKQGQEIALRLSATARGIKSAQLRLAEIRRAQNGLAVYGPKGDAQHIDMTQPRTSRF